MDDLQPALSALLSLRSSSIQINGALSRLHACLASIALEAASSTPVVGWREDQNGGHSSSGSTRRTAFLRSQASFQHNGELVLASSRFRAKLRERFAIQNSGGKTCRIHRKMSATPAEHQVWRRLPGDIRPARPEHEGPPRSPPPASCQPLAL